MIYQTINIFLFVVLVAIHNSISVIDKNNHDLLTKYPTNNKNGQCVKKVSEILFQSLTNLHHNQRQSSGSKKSTRKIIVL